MIIFGIWRCANICEPCGCVRMNLMSLGGRRVARLGSYPIYISSGHIYRRSYPNQVPERTTLDGCYPTKTSTLLSKEMVLAWVCGCVSVYPTQPENLTWLIKIGKLGHKMHSLITSYNEMENYFELVHWTCRHFSASCILHVGTLLSFPKLIPSLYM